MKDMTYLDRVFEVSGFEQVNFVEQEDNCRAFELSGTKKKGVKTLEAPEKVFA